MDLFYFNKNRGIEISWKELIDIINSTVSYNPYCYETEFLKVFVHIIKSLVLKENIILLDSDFSESELQNLVGKTEFSQYDKIVESAKAFQITSKEELIKRIKTDNEDWKMTLFTSGTTGLPKRVIHSFETITRFVKESRKHTNNVWGFAYNPTHMAGVQVFFQALLNGNSIVNLFGLSKDLIFDSIQEKKVTNISATPTFYRLLLPADKCFNSVQRITSGGEKFDINTRKQLNGIFPNAKLTNVYASTEAGSILAAEGENFIVKAGMEELIKVVDDELLIHTSLLGNLESMQDQWYNTGDMVNVLSRNPLTFTFVSRKNEMINVGGYKVNPNEVEEQIRNLKDVVGVRVFSKSNSVLGNIICCEIKTNSKSPDELTVRNFLKDRLQEFKIPRIIKFVDDISVTRTGKIKRH